jgi:hypothetical protein
VTKREPARIPVGDRDVERALDEHRNSIIALARDPFINARTIEVTLPDATTVRVRHKLGRAFTNFVLSPPKGPSTSGRIEELTSGDPTSEIWLEANGYGATITVRLTVW